MRTSWRWIKRILAKKKYTIEPKPTLCLWNFGNRLGKINNELQVTNITKGSAITPKDIEENIDSVKILMCLSSKQ
jgi:hypothetical protein